MTNKMTIMRSPAFAVLALAAAAAQACRVAPPAQLIGAGEQVAAATDVAVAQVIGATPLDAYEVEYRFLVLDQLAGVDRKVFSVTGRAAPPQDQDGSFDRHRDFAFWAHGGGRVVNGVDCVIHPSFVVGNSYLVFLGARPTRRSFEQLDTVDGIVNPDDEWLAYVKARLAGQAAQHDGAPDYERLGRFIYGLQRIIVSGEIDRKTLAAQHAPDQLLYRAGRLEDEFDRIYRNHQNVPDPEMAAALREAIALKAALQAWRSSAGQ